MQQTFPSIGANMMFLVMLASTQREDVRIEGMMELKQLPKIDNASVFL